MWVAWANCNTSAFSHLCPKDDIKASFYTLLSTLTSVVNGCLETHWCDICSGVADTSNALDLDSPSCIEIRRAWKEVHFQCLHWWNLSLHLRLVYALPLVNKNFQFSFWSRVLSMPLPRIASAYSFGSILPLSVVLVAWLFLPMPCN